MKDRLLTLDDLLEYYSTRKKSLNFNCTNGKEPIVVQVKGSLSFEGNDTNDLTEGLTAVTLQACHTEKNLNGSTIKYDVMKDRLVPTFKNRPILGYIHDVNGEQHFYGHNVHVDAETKNIVYDEAIVGVIPETNNIKLEYDEENDRYNVIVDGYIYDEYTAATEILKREGECNVSVEISIRAMSYNHKEKTLTIEDGYFSGVTILGVDDTGNEIKPGMAGSNIKLKDFSMSNNSMFSNMTDEQISQLTESMNEIDELLSKISAYSQENNGKEDISMKDTYKKDDADQTKDAADVGDTDDDAVDVDDIDRPDDTTDDTDETDVTDDSDDADVEDGNEKNRSNDTYSKTFEMSHDDIRRSLYVLLAVQETEDNTSYYINEVFDDYFVYSDWRNDLIYGQKYNTDKESEVVSFDGERYRLFVEYLTENEKTVLKDMRENYSAMQEELGKYKHAEEFADKMTVFEDAAYAEYLDTAEFKELMSEENINKYSKTELADKADVTFAKIVKKNKTFAFSKELQQTKKEFFAFPKKEKSSFLDGLLKG